MKKIFTIAAALMASVAMMAAEPNYESSLWGADDFATVIADHDGITLSTSLTKWGGNFSGSTVQYLNMGGGTDMSADAPTPYFAISATSVIDSVEIYWAPNGSNASNLAWAAWKNAANLLAQDVDYLDQTAEFTGSKSVEGATWQKINLSGKEVKAIMISRQIKKAKLNGVQQSNIGKNQTVNIIGVRVWVQETKTVVSTVESLTAVTINDVAISAENLASLVSTHTLFLDDSYVTAPVMKFTKHTVITYDDQSTKEKDEVIEKTAQEATAGMWGAFVSISETAYSVYVHKSASFNVNYYDGETLLGTEVVEANGTAVEHDAYAVKPLAQFVAWYSDAEMTQEVTNWTITADVNFYGKWTKAYATSMNIEGLVLSEGTGYDIATALTSANFAFTDIDALDSLNDLEKKTNRNYAFLGLKVKKASSYLAFNLQQGHSVKVRMGNVAEAFTLKVNGAALDLATKTLANTSVNDVNVWEYSATDGDALIEFTGFTKDKTVVFKQIMIDADIQIPNLPAPGAYPITLNVGEHGTLVATWEGKTDKKVNVPVGAEVKLTPAPEEGYITTLLTYNGVALYDEAVGYVTFVMPAEEVVVVAEFGPKSATSINNTEAEVKAVKMIENGQMVILKNGVKYNAQGAIVK